MGDVIDLTLYDDVEDIPVPSLLSKTTKNKVTKAENTTKSVPTRRTVEIDDSCRDKAVIVDDADAISGIKTARRVEVSMPSVMKRSDVLIVKPSGRAAQRKPRTRAKKSPLVICLDDDSTPVRRNVLPMRRMESFSELIGFANARRRKEKAESASDDDIVVMDGPIPDFGATKRRKIEEENRPYTGKTLTLDEIDLSNVYNCCICMEEEFDKPVFSRNCGHCFCRDCIVEWVEHKKQCPICRTKLLRGDLVPISDELMRNRHNVL